MNPLAGKRVLVAEDEPVVAMLLEDILSGLGCAVVGPSGRLGQALELARREAIDAAVLDINIKGGHSYPVADELERRGVPYLFATGYGVDGVEPERRRVPVLEKPYSQEQIRTALLLLLQR